MEVCHWYFGYSNSWSDHRRERKQITHAIPIFMKINDKCREKNSHVVWTIQGDYVAGIRGRSRWTVCTFNIRPSSSSSIWIAYVLIAIHKRLPIRNIPCSVDWFYCIIWKKKIEYRQMLSHFQNKFIRCWNWEKEKRILTFFINSESSNVHVSTSN